MSHAIAVAATGVILVLGLFAGCATRSSTPMVYQKAGVTDADQQRDENICLRASVGLDDRGFILLPFDTDRDAYHRCMREHGYAIGPGR
jgi:hypothetical protein